MARPLPPIDGREEKPAVRHRPKLLDVALNPYTATWERRTSQTKAACGAHEREGLVWLAEWETEWESQVSCPECLKLAAE